MYRPLIVFLCGVAAAAPPSYRISTIAGNDHAGDGRPALEAVLSQPEGIAGDGWGNLYIADAMANRVRRIGPDGRISTVVGDGFAGFAGDGGAASAARLNTPYGLAVDGAGSLYIADLSNARVRKVTAAGIITTVAGGGAIAPASSSANLLATDALLVSPRNIAVDRDGNLYISDFGAHRVYKVLANGIIFTVAGTGVAGSGGDHLDAARAQLSSPAGLAVDSRGTLYIADSGNKRVRVVAQGKIAPLGDATPLVGEPLELQSVTGVAVDAADSIYLADRQPRIYRVSTRGGVTTLPVGGSDVWVDGGRVYTGAKGQVSMYAGGRVSAIAGGGSMPVVDGAPALESRLSVPAGIAADPSGNLYVSEQGSGRVRRIDAAGAITTAVSDLFTPAGLAVCGGNLIVADSGAHSLYRLDGTGRLVRIAGTGAAGLGGNFGWASVAELSAPAGVACDAEGNAYIADSGNQRLRMITASGTILPLAGGGNERGDGLASAVRLVQPHGIAVAPNGDIWFTEAGANRVRKLDRKTSAVTTATTLITDPRGIALTAEGDLVVAGAGGHQVARIDAAGAVTILAGTGKPGYTGDGDEALKAQLRAPAAVAVRSDGTIVIADTGNHRLRALAPSCTSGCAIAGELVEAALVVRHWGTRREEAVAPGQLVSIGGVAADAKLQIEIGGTVAEIVRSTDLVAVVPEMLEPGREFEVVARLDGGVIGRGRVRIVALAPAILADENGSAIAANESGRPNSDADPATRGSVVTLYLTGNGRVNEAEVEVAGLPCVLLYAGRAPGMPGVMQINVQLPVFVQPGRLELLVRLGVASARATIAVR